METVDVIVQPAIEPQVIDSNLTMTWNNAELAKYLEEKLEKYNGLVVTEDNLKEMKSVLKEIVSIRTKLTRFGADKKRELKIPYNTFTSELEQVLAVVSRVENPIANQIGEFEQREMLKHKDFVLHLNPTLAPDFLQSLCLC